MNHHYEFHAYFKQGDDFHHFLSQGKDVHSALKLWAANMRDAAARMEELATLIEGKNIEADAGTHMVQFSGDDSVLEEAVKRQLLYKWDFEDEEDYEENEEGDGGEGQS